MAEEIKLWKDLTKLEQVKRRLLAEEGLVCKICGTPGERCSNETCKKIW